MTKLRIFLLTLLTILSVFGSRVAQAGFLDSVLGLKPEMTCVNTLSLIDSLVDTFTTPIYSNIIKENFSMNVPGAEGSVPEQSNGYYVYNSTSDYTDGEDDEEKRCFQPTPDVKIRYFNGLKLFGWDGLGKEQFLTLQADGPSKTTDTGIRFRARTAGDTLCVETPFTTGWRKLGCKPAQRKHASSASVACANSIGMFDANCPPPKGALNLQDMLIQAGCSVGGTCTHPNNTRSVSILPFTSVMVECMIESIQGLFRNEGEACGVGGAGSVFSQFQTQMRDTVRLVLILYVILFAIKVMLGQEAPKSGDLLMFLLKFAFVLYFAVGVQTSGTDRVQDGMSEFLMPAMQGAANSLATVVYQAGQGNDLCRYTLSDYGGDENLYNKLAMWDGMDCRIAYYLGITNPSLIAQFMGNGSAASTAWSVGKTMAMMVGMPVFSIVLAALMGFQIFFAIFCIVFSVCVVSIVIYFVNVFILCTIGMYIVGFFAPIFIPCVLFQVTKSYFDAWLKLMISYALQPTVLAAFIALMFTTFDQTMYGDCTFTKTQLPAPMRTALASVLNPRGILFLYANATTDGCKDSPGYRFNGMTTSNSLTRIDLVFFNLDILNNWTTVSVFPAMFKMFVVGFLFWHFSKMLGAFASDLTGGPNMSALAVAPTAFAKLAAKVAVIAARVAAGDAEGAAKDVASEVKQGAEDSAKPDDKDKG